MICNDRKSFPNAAGGLRVLQPPQQVQGRAPEIWHLKVQNTAEKLNFMVQFLSKEKIIHLKFQVEAENSSKAYFAFVHN